MNRYPSHTGIIWSGTITFGNSKVKFLLKSDKSTFPKPSGIFISLIVVKIVFKVSSVGFSL